MRTDLIKKMAAYGDEYVEKQLQKYNKEILSKDWQEGLKFLFDHSFYQGRRDCISCEVERRAINTLKNYLKENSENPQIIFDKEYFPEIRSRLMKVIGKGEIGRGRDIDMIMSMLIFISKIKDISFEVNDKNSEISNINIINYSISKIQKDGLRNHFKELQTIFSIGPKCSSFYLRDLISIYSEDVKIQKDELEYLQPIDVWVRKVAFITEIIDDLKEKDKTIREKIVDACSEEKARVSEIRFNQGAWYLGHNSFDIVMENLIENKEFPLVRTEKNKLPDCGSFK